MSHADPAPTIHYAPAENLEHIDVGLLDSAKHEIDLAAYVLVQPIAAIVAQRASHQSARSTVNPKKAKAAVAPACGCAR